ncbi:ATP-binding protein [Marinilactibacillus kalidii]|uniref:ATP-binding protein n=1 Tax=Marinilactibacillus kalidii TaxID=2820274 RepID=UPI001ABE5AC9|nr:ATP-binding protein [Marinilactibacillus kalidii]
MMNEQVLPDIPRFYTAIAEVASCVIFIWPFITKRQASWFRILLMILAFGSGQILLQALAGKLPIILWIPGMLVNIVWMVLTIVTLSKVNYKIGLYLFSKAFILSEFMASIFWLLYCITLYPAGIDSSFVVFIFGACIYSIVLFQVFKIEKNTQDHKFLQYIDSKEVIIINFLVITIFGTSNSGFLLSNTNYNFGNTLAVFVIRSIVDISGLCIIYLYNYVKIDNLNKQELNLINNLFNNQYLQYKTYAENTQYINRKAHDLKHQIDVILSEQNIRKRETYLARIKRSIEELGLKIETGNAVLDTMLTQKNIHCKENQINLTCIANGKLINQFEVMDICSLVGNALDNAIEHVEKIEDEEKRLITFKLAKKGKMGVMNVSNYCLEDIFLDGTLPETSKVDKDNHGFGLKSIQYIVEKYDGNMHIDFSDNWFNLRIIFPLEG